MKVSSYNKEIIRELFILYPNVKYGLVEQENLIYVRGVLKSEHVYKCVFWKVDGIIADHPALVQDNLKKFENINNSLV
jgi:hypothetical protein